MALLIARHGETALNVAGIVQPADTGLSPHGLQQADALGARLAREYRVAAIVASDLPRARQTAERVADGCARLVARVSRSTQAAADRLADAEHVLLVTHGLVVRRLLAAHIEGGAASVRAGPPANASLVVAEVIEGRLRLALGPCTAHLARLPPQARDGVIGL